MSEHSCVAKLSKFGLYKTLVVLLLVPVLLACEPKTAEGEKQQKAAEAEKSVGEEKAAEVDESARVNKILDDMFDEVVALSPESQTFLGLKTNYDKWDDRSEAQSKRYQDLYAKQLAIVKSFDVSKLDENTRLSVKLARQSLEEDIEDYQWRHHNYPVNQMFGTHSGIPSLLINQHTIENLEQAEAYISRLKAVPKVIDQLIDNLEIRAEKKIIAPSFVFPHVIRDSKNLLKGAPYEEGEDTALLADFKKKIGKLEMEEAEQKRLESEAVLALTEQLAPAYRKLVAYLQALSARTKENNGAWALPDGEAFYKVALKRTTTTDLSAEEIHQVGLDEVARIHEEMRGIMKTVGFEGDLQAFFKFMRTDKQFYYDETPEAKQRYLTEATAIIDNMKSRMDELFIRKPKAELTVKAVEPFREESAGKAFYQRPSADGKRPGIYYANLFKMSDMPTYQMEALAYHEGVPGHHMQLAIQQELENMPKFRRFGSYTAYTEGWGLYSELVPKEMGLYEDPYSDFGRLTMELWRACRLVVDTGLHAKKWTREEAIDYLASNTPDPHPAVVKAIERYMVMPSQATAYKIGMLKIVELREKARTTLGDKFDIRAYHDVVLRYGAVPLNVLSDNVDAWVKSVKAER